MTKEWLPANADELPEKKGRIPGPRSARIIRADQRLLSPSYTRDYPLVIHQGRGCIVEDPDGNTFLDFNAGIAVLATGHCHPRILAAIEKQSQRFVHYSGTDFYYDVQNELAKKIVTHTPISGPKKVFYTNSGTEAVEAAIKLARFHTKRPNLISFLGSFHGRTMGSLSLTASKTRQKEGFGPFLPGVTHINYAHCYYAKDKTECALKPIRYLEEQLFKRSLPPATVAAIFVEPIQGEGGYIVPPTLFLKELRRICTKHGILLVFDEVQSGMGRSGKFFAAEHFDVEPDMITLAKGIASGLPLGCLVAKSKVMDWPYGAHASTFGGNPVACAAAVETFNLLEKGLLEHTRTLGAYMHKRMQGWVKKYKHVGRVQGKGLMIGLGIVYDKKDNIAHFALRNKIVEACFKKQLLILGCGPAAIRLCPPLVLSKTQADWGMDVLEECIRKLSR